jgi:hypothetical protein
MSEAGCTEERRLTPGQEVRYYPIGRASVLAEVIGTRGSRIVIHVTAPDWKTRRRVYVKRTSLSDING